MVGQSIASISDLGEHIYFGCIYRLWTSLLYYICISYTTLESGIN